jgi:hypothetical protein
MEATMNLLNLSDDERSAKRLMSVLSTDCQGKEILCGLTREESEWMIEYLHRYPIPLRARAPSANDRKTYVALHEKHNVARLYR